MRWESIEILLAPEDHVPFLQFAVRNWGLTNPDDGKPFPVDLPKEAFPSQPDEAIDKWHRECATKLRRETTPKDENKPSSGIPDGHRVREFYRRHGTREAMAAGMAAGVAGMSAAAAAASAKLRPEADYFAGARPIPAYTHVPPRQPHPPSRQGSGMSPRSPERERYRDHERDRDKDGYTQRHHGSSSDEHRGSAGRRRSLGDYPTPSPHEAAGMSASAHIPGPVHLDPKGPKHAQPRRHSQPRHFSSPSDSEEPISPRTTKRSPVRHYSTHKTLGDPNFTRPAHEAEPVGGAKRVYTANTPTGGRTPVGITPINVVPPSPIAMPQTANIPIADGRMRSSSGSRVDQVPRSRVSHTGFDIREKLHNIIPGISSHERHRSGSRGDRDRERDRERDRDNGRYSREYITGSRLSRSWSNEDGDSEDDDTDGEKERRRRRDYDRDHTRDREKQHRDRTRREREREDRAARDRDRSGRDKDRERNRRRQRASSDDENMSPGSRRDTGGSSSSAYHHRPQVPRRVSSHADIDRRHHRDRDLDERYTRRDRDYDREPIVTGVGGRRYPDVLRT